MKIDYLIVGSGIAGTVLANLLLKRHKSILVVDQPDPSSASNVSAGICNPVVFKRLTPSWMAERLLKKGQEVYQEFESLLQTEIVQQKKTFKLFTSNDEKAMWEQKSQLPELMDFIAIAKNKLPANIFNNVFGAGEVNNGMQVNIQHLIQEFHQHLLSKELLIRQQFQHHDLSLDQDGVKWNNVTAKQVVFCEGHHVLKNPYFNWLPLNPVKGEAIIIESKELNIEYLVNKKITLCPLGNNRFWVGGTYDWKQLDQVPTKTAKEELVEALEQILKSPYQIIDHKAAIRPAAKDRRPLIGVHPDHERLFVFNGMGTKGTMITPYFALQLIDFMENQQPLDREVSIERYYHLHDDYKN